MSATLFEDVSSTPAHDEANPGSIASDHAASDLANQPNFMSLPLAFRMRPRNFDEFAGQTHLVNANAPLRRAVEADRAPSCVFFGPAGTGKTTLGATGRYSFSRTF
jgi:replication-associated recombination protein RarA